MSKMCPPASSFAINHPYNAWLYAATNTQATWNREQIHYIRDTKGVFESQDTTETPNAALYLFLLYVRPLIKNDNSTSWQHGLISFFFFRITL